MDDVTMIRTSPFSDDVLEQFPGAEQGVYLNSCARGLLPLAAKEALEAYLEGRVLGNTDKAAAFETVERVRGNFAALINAEADEIALTKNVSEGLSVLAAALPWQAGDNVVVCLDLEHPNNMYPWFNLREREGIEVRAVPAEGGHISADAMVGAMDERTRCVTLSSVSFSPGFRTDVAAVGAACREHGAFLLVDAVQSVGILDTDVEVLGIDGLAVSTQKGLLGLYGFGFLYCRNAWAERMTPVSLARFGVDLGAGAHEAAKGSDQYALMPGARRFDLGNYNYPGAVACDQSLQLLRSVGTPAIEAHVGGLSHRLAAGLLDLGLPVAGGEPGPHLGSIVSVGAFGEGGHDSTDDPRIAALYEHLSANDVTLTIRQGMLRMAFHLYNTQEDVDQVVELCAGWLRAN